MPKQPMIKRTDLQRVLTEAKLFAHKDSSFPMLHSVRLEAVGTHLIAVGCDRFALGASSAEYEGTPFTVTLPMQSVDLMLAACRIAKTDRRTDVVDLRVTPKGTLLHATLGVAVVTVPTLEDAPAYPDWRKLIGASTNDVADVAGTIGINPQLLAKFGKIGHQAKFYIQPGIKPVGVQIGDHFTGAVMPIRIPSDVPKTWELPAWLGGTTAAAVKAVA